MTNELLRRVAPEDVPDSEARSDPVDAETLAAAAEIVDAVRREGEVALRRFAERFGDIEPAAPLVLGRDEICEALDSVDAKDRELLVRVAERIDRFAGAQRASVGAVDVEVPGGRAGQRVDPVDRAGCYAPGGRFPLPSSVLMTGVNDLRTPISQTEEFYQALKVRKVPAVMLSFNDEYHGTSSKPSNFLRTLGYLESWFGKWPEKKTQP